MPMELKNHDLADVSDCPGVRIEHTPVKDPSGAVAEGLHATRITLDTAFLKKQTVECPVMRATMLRLSSNVCVRFETTQE